MNIKESFMKLATNLGEASPKIKIVVGVIGLIGAGVAACVASTKVKEKTEEEYKALEDIHKVRMSQKDELPEEEKISEDLAKSYSEKDYAKDVIKVGFSYGKKLVRLYWLPILITVLSTGLILNGTHVLSTRNLALSAAYTSLSGAFEAYRERVKERYGQEVEDELHYGVEYKKLKEVTVDENGEEKVNTIKAPVVKGDVTKANPYAIIFDEKFDEYVGDLDYDRVFLNGIQAMLNDSLNKKRPYITLGDLWTELGRRLDPEDEKTKDLNLMSMRCGWRHGDKIDLRVKRVFMQNGKEAKSYFLLDPNVRDIYAEIVMENKYENETSAV